jgi:ubiquinone/menaquinone biosynthesis C-methylase UbiE
MRTQTLADSRNGAKVYSLELLTVYDWLVLRVNARLLWGCSASAMLDLYNAHVSAHHLDVGVGSGYFLDKCRFPTSSPRICLFDLNENSLAHTARRIARYRPETCRGDVLQPLPFSGRCFDSVGLSAVLHVYPVTCTRNPLLS